MIDVEHYVLPSYDQMYAESTKWYIVEAKIFLYFRIFVSDFLLFILVLFYLINICYAFYASVFILKKFVIFFLYFSSIFFFYFHRIYT